MKYLKENRAILVLSSDKGGKAVIMDRYDYLRKMNEHINAGIEKSVYKRIDHKSIDCIRKEVETTFKRKIETLNPFLLLDGFSPYKLMKPEPYLIPRIYGCPKIHKTDVPMRPIISSPDMIGHALSSWLLSHLKSVADHLDKFNVVNATRLIADLKYCRLEQGHRLFSYDYVSMFTNVNIRETEMIILEFYHLITAKTTVTFPVFIEMLRLYTVDTTYFMYNDGIYIQTKGLAMGNRLAQFLAEIYTNYALYKVLNSYDAEDITMFRKYVDDVLSGGRVELIDEIKRRIETETNMELTLTMEDENNEIEFLDCIVHRNSDGSLSHRWTKKPYSSLSVLNYHSYHPIHMKHNVINEMIKRAFVITSPEYIDPVPALRKSFRQQSSTNFSMAELHRPNPAGSWSGNIRKNLRYFGIFYNEDAVVVLTEKNIPIYLKVVASLGKNFSYVPEDTDVSSSIDMLICLSKLSATCNSYPESYNVNRKINQVKNGIFDREKYFTGAQKYINELLCLSKNFLRKNPDIIVVESDKGGKSVIMDKDLYEQKMYEHLNENLMASTYLHCVDLCLTDLCTDIEERYREIVSLVNPFFNSSKNQFEKPLRPEPYLIPRIYGCPKIHKPGIPVRPIIASADMIGANLSEWLLQSLMVIAKSLRQHDVDSSIVPVSELKHFKVEDGHKLFSLDYVSMFTNVDVRYTIRIILDNYYLLDDFTAVPADVFVKCLEFYTSESAFFTFKGDIYKQAKGLAMGNKIAQVMAEIRTNHAIRLVLPRYDAALISFFYKYVDDILSAADESVILPLKADIEFHTSMKLTLTNEEVGSNSVDFLDCTFLRRSDNSIACKWFKKEYGSMSILNFHSHHPFYVKLNTVVEMIRRARFNTDPEHAPATEALLRRILENSSYPESFIVEKMHVDVHVPLSPRAPSTTIPNGVFPGYRFVSCPYQRAFVATTKQLISMNKLPAKLAVKPMLKNRDKLYRNVKDFRPHLQI
ncbi:hypothetical protein HA402_004240 [Bradysia odoriphaga]|nr:hypothetical protein HA402_004240 [Bradysia odoriphaga]